MSHRDRYLYDLEQEKIERNERFNWTPLLLLPIFIGLGWGSYQWMQNLSSTENATSNSMEFGIGGAPPVTLGPSPSIPVVSPTGNTYNYQAPAGTLDTGSRVGGW